MNLAGAADDDQAVIPVMQDQVNRGSVLNHRIRGALNREFGLHLRRRADLLGAGDTDVLCLFSAWCRRTVAWKGLISPYNSGDSDIKLDSVFVIRITM